MSRKFKITSVAGAVIFATSLIAFVFMVRYQTSILCYEEYDSKTLEKFEVCERDGKIISERRITD